MSTFLEYPLSMHALCAISIILLINSCGRSEPTFCSSRISQDLHSEQLDLQWRAVVFIEEFEGPTIDAKSFRQFTVDEYREFLSKVENWYALQDSYVMKREYNRFSDLWSPHFSPLTEAVQRLDGSETEQNPPEK